MANAIERNLKKEMSEPVDLALARATSNMWDEVLRTFRTTPDKAEGAYLAQVKSEFILILMTISRSP